ATLQPALSPMLWTSIATGKRAYDHGVCGFTEVEPLSGRVQPVTAASRKAKALWNILDERGMRCHVVGWFATHGERLANGRVVSNLFTPPRPGAAATGLPRGTVWPEDLAEDLAPLRVGYDEIGSEVVSMFVPRWREV